MKVTGVWLPAHLGDMTSTAKKFGIAIVGALAQALALGLIPEPYDKWASVVVALGVALGVYRVPNTTEEQQ